MLDIWQMEEAKMAMEETSAQSVWTREDGDSLPLTPSGAYSHRHLQ